MFSMVWWQQKSQNVRNNRCLQTSVLSKYLFSFISGKFRVTKRNENARLNKMHLAKHTFWIYVGQPWLPNSRKYNHLVSVILRSKYADEGHWVSPGGSISSAGAASSAVAPRWSRGGSAVVKAPILLQVSFWGAGASFCGTSAPLLEVTLFEHIWSLWVIKPKENKQLQKSTFF